MLNKIIHFLRYGTHQERDLFLDGTGRATYDAVMINANMLAYTPKAMSAFALRLNKPFFIDPQTHAFQHGFEFVSKNGIPKQSIQNLATLYGEPVFSALTNGGAISNTDFISHGVITSFVEKVMAFQLENIHTLVTTGPEADYINFAMEDTSSGLSKENITPRGVIAPYLYIGDSDNDSLSTNNLFLIESKKQITDKKLDIPLIAQIVMSKNSLINQAFRKSIIDVYKNAPVNAIFIWVDEFDETEVSEEFLEGFKTMVSELAVTGKKIVNLYGGYFSILLTKVKNGLSGVCHGMEYGESRKVVPVGGGLPRAKYYFPPLHKRLRSEDFRRIVIANTGWDLGTKNVNFKKEVCDCDQCVDIDQYSETQTYQIKSKTGSVRRGETSTSAAKEHSLLHYLVNKKKEYDYVINNTLDILIENLRQAKEKYEPSAGKENTDHLDRWINVLK